AETLHLYHAALNQEGIGVVSLAPAISLQCLQKKLPRSQLVRVMPNTPSAIHRGVTGMVANALLDIEIKTLVEQLFSSIGICAWVADEKQLDVVTALSGSGPAYYFCIVEIFIKKAIEKGLPE